MAGGTRQKFLAAEKQLRGGEWQKAQALYQAVLRKRPDDAGALAGCAEAALRLGSIYESERLLAQAKRLKPNDVRVLVGLGRLHAHRKEFKDALRHFRSALKKEPKCVTAMMESASVFIATFQPQRAIAQLRPALVIDPKNITMIQFLGDAYQQVGRWNEAVHAYETARRNGCANENLLYNLATAYRAIGQFDNAESTYLEVLEQHPGFTEAQAGLAELYETTGHTERAQLFIIKCLESNTNHTAPFGNVVTRLARKSGKINDAIAFLQNALREPGILKENQAQLFFQLGALLEDDQKWDDAFDSYRKANELFPKTFDAVGYNGFINDLISVFSKKNMTRFPKSGIESTLPVFIVGMPRSGTSLVEQIIAAHPSAYAAGELNFLSQLITTLPNNLHARQPYPRCMEKITAESLDTISSQYLESLNNTIADNHEINSYLRITDKMPHNFTHLGIISLLFPNAKIVHCRRDPVDTCFSCYATSLSTTHSYANRLEDLVAAYRAYDRLMCHWATVIDPTQRIEVSYETLATEPEEITKSIIAFLDLPWDESCLRFHENERIILTASQDQATQPVYTTSIGRSSHFKDHLETLFTGLSSTYN